MDAMMGGKRQSLPEVLGDYQVLGRLATGGMAELFLGRRVGPSGFQRTVAIKMILPHLARNSGFVTMFLDEARIAASIHHPNVVTVDELRNEGEELFMVMEYLAGETTSILLSRLVARQRLLDPALAAFIVAEMCAGLHAAHELKDEDGAPCAVIHRDVSPQNIFVTYDGMVKILDFGVAKAADRLTATKSGLIKGKFEYMSPEQIMGGTLDHRSDIFPTGIVLFELLTGRRLFKGVNDAATVRVLLERRVDPPSAYHEAVPAALDEICLKALARSKRRRYATAAELRRDLVAVIRDLEPNDLPEQRLAKLMHELFEERIASKLEMLRQARESAVVNAIVESDTSIDIELPAATIEIQSVLETEIIEAPKSGRASWVVALVVAAAVLSLLTVAAVAIMNFGGQLPLISEQTVTAQDDAPTDVALRTVKITVTSEPAGASVVIDGEERFRTPGELTLLRGERPVNVKLVLHGYRTSEELIVPDTDLRLRVNLSEESTSQLQTQPQPEVDPVKSSHPTSVRKGRKSWPRQQPAKPSKTKNAFELWE